MGADDERCSFCGKWRKKVRTLIAGPGVYICDECVSLCVAILEQKGDTGTPKQPWFKPWQRLRRRSWTVSGAPRR